MGREQSVTVMPEPKARKRPVWKKLLLFVFFGIVATLLYFAMTGETSLTGNAVNVPGNDGDAAIEHFSLKTRLDNIQEPIELKQEMESVKIRFRGSSGAITIGKDNVYNLQDIKEPVVELSLFDGTISFDDEKILKLKGKVSTVVINGIPVTSSTQRIAIEVDEGASYDSLELSSIFLKRYKSVASGEVDIEDGTFDLHLNKDIFSIEQFHGSVHSGDLGGIFSTKEGFVLDGTVEEVSVEGRINLGVRV